MSDKISGKNKGFTLLEVLLSLVIAGIFLGMSLNIIGEQERGSKTLKNQLELRYSLLNAGRTVSDAIRTAKSVQWVSHGELSILPWPESGNLQADLYYLDDKDKDGTKDLYREHLNVANPLATYVTEWLCTEVEPGLWKIHLKARIGQESAIWETYVRQRAD